jgi:hypothetical protein
MAREIVGLREGVCLYVEQMPNGGIITGYGPV